MEIKDCKIFIDYDIKKKILIPEDDITVEDMEKTKKKCDYYRTLNGFIEENTKEINEAIKKVENKEIFIFISKYDLEHRTINFIYSLKSLSLFDSSIIYDVARVDDYLRDNEIQDLLNLLKIAKENKEKRCQTWFKRYGKRCLRVSTFWAQK